MSDCIEYIINNGIELYTKDLFRDIYIEYTYCDNNINLSSSVNKVTQQNIFRALEVLKYGFVAKIEKEIESLIDWNQTPEKIDMNPNIFAPVYTVYEIKTYIKRLPPICDQKILEVEDKYLKKIGLQVFDFKANASEKLKIIPDHTKEEYRFHTGIFFEITNFKAKIVEVE